MQTPWRKLYILSIAGGLSWLGSALNTFAVVLRDKDHVGAAGVAGYLLAFGLPTIFMAPISGLIADKFSTRTVILPALFVMGLSSATLALGLPLWWTPIALVITATAGTLVGPASQAMQVLYTHPDDRPRVTGLMQSMASAGMLVAPAVGGILVSTTGYFWPFVIDALSFWILGLTFWGIGLNRQPVQHEAGEKFSAIAGAKFVFSDRLIRALVILVSVLIVALGSFNVGEVFLVKDELHASDFIYGVVSAMFAAGEISGAILTASVKLNRKFHASATVFGIAILVLAIFGFSLASHWWMAMVLAFITGFGNAVLNAYAISIVMTRSPKEMLGRVNAAIGAIIQSGGVIGIVLSGYAIKIWGVRPVTFVASIISALILLIFAPDVLRYGRHHVDEASPAKA